MPIVQASFFYKNNEPGGIGFMFAPPIFSSSELERMFNGAILKRFLTDSDAAMGTNVVGRMFDQLRMVGEMKQMSTPIGSRLTVLSALNIIWLTKRGFLAQDEFNGYQFVTDMSQTMNGKPA